MADAWRAYLEMALGLAEVPRKKAQQVVDDLVNRGGATAAQLQGLVEDALGAGMANREALTKIVRFEVDRALGVVGLATADEVTELTDRVRDLERQLRLAQDRLSAPDSGPESGSDPEPGPAFLPDPDAPTADHATRSDTPAPMPGTPLTPAKKAVAKKTAKKAVAKRTPGTVAVTGTVGDAAAAGFEPAPATEPPATEPPAKKAAKKAAAKKAAPSADPAAPRKRAPANKGTRTDAAPKTGNVRGAGTRRPRAGDTPAGSPDDATPSLPPPPEPPAFDNTSADDTRADDMRAGDIRADGTQADDATGGAESRP